MRLNNSSKVIAGALLLSAASLSTACTRSGEDPAPPTPSVTRSAAATAPDSPTPSADPALAEAEAAILDAYRGYWAAKVAILADTAVDPGADLDRYAVDTARAGVLETLLTYRTNRIDMVGEPVLHPEVSDIKPGDEGTATIVDCIDVADWQPVHRDTLDPAAAPGQAIRVLATSSAFFFDGHWTIRSYEVDRETPC